MSYPITFYELIHLKEIKLSKTHHISETNLVFKTRKIVHRRTL